MIGGWMFIVLGITILGLAFLIPIKIYTSKGRWTWSNQPYPPPAYMMFPLALAVGLASLIAGIWLLNVG